MYNNLFQWLPHGATRCQMSLLLPSQLWASPEVHQMPYMEASPDDWSRCVIWMQPGERGGWGEWGNVNERQEEVRRRTVREKRKRAGPEQERREKGHESCAQHMSLRAEREGSEMGVKRPPPFSAMLPHQPLKHRETWCNLCLQWSRASHASVLARVRPVSNAS